MQMKKLTLSEWIEADSDFDPHEAAKSLFIPRSRRVDIKRTSSAGNVEAVAPPDAGSSPAPTTNLL